MTLLRLKNIILSKETFRLVLFFVLVSAFLFYLEYRKPYINGNVLNLPYININIVEREKLVSPWNNNNNVSLALLFRSLFATDSTFQEIKNDLAESYETSNDGLVYRIKLKKNLYWSDGVPLTTEDVEFSIKTAIHAYNLNAMCISAFDKIVGAEEFEKDFNIGLRGLTITESTITIILSQAHHPMLQALAQFAILPKHLLKDELPKKVHLSSYWKKPITNGMYTVKELVDDEYFLLIRNEYYTGTKPKIDEVRLYFDPKAETMDYYSTNNVKEIVDYSGLRGFGKYDVNMLFYRYFIFNLEEIDGNKNEAMQDKRIREAIISAINREKLGYDIYYNTVSLVNSGVPHFNSAVNDFEYIYDPEKSRQLLEEAGYDFNRELKIAYHYTDEVSLYFMEAVANNLRQVGFNVKIVFNPNGYKLLFEDRDYDLALKGLAAFDIAEWYGEYLSINPLFINIFGGNTDFDKLINSLIDEKDYSVHYKILQKLQSLEQQELKKFPLFLLPQVVYINANRLSIPENTTFGNTWYRYDVGFENWEIKRR